MHDSPNTSSAIVLQIKFVSDVLKVPKCRFYFIFLLFRIEFLWDSNFKLKVCMIKF